MGLLEACDWHSHWIAADPEIIRRDPAAVASTLAEPGTPGLFRRAFDVPGLVRRATVYASARGLFELRLNGQRVGDDLFAPEWTDYDKRIQYRAYDVTAMLAQGRNALGAVLGDGWWSGYVGWQETRGRYGSLENSLLVQLEVEFANGAMLTVGTDAAWRCATGPIVSSDFMMGEVYDARRERAGWDRPDFVDRAWLPARAVAPPTVPLVAQRSEPVRITEELEPVAQRKIRPGVFIYDLGQNISGWVRLRVANLPVGTRLTLRHGERLNPDGTLYTENLRRAQAADTYLCRGGGEEVWMPHFTFHGFQFVELSVEPTVGSTAQPPAGACHAIRDKLMHGIVGVTGCVIGSVTPPAGHFACSHSGVNRLWLNGVWSQRDNFLSVPTDCPQRDERLGWMGDAQVFLRTATCNRDVAAFFTKWMIDVEDAQTADGVFPDTAPRLREGENFVGLGNLGGSAGWADAGVIVPYTLWRVYGDRRIVERHWDAMVKWVDWIDRHNPSGLRLNQLGNNYGDWLCIPSDTSFGTHSPMKNLLATAYWADDAAKLARLARVLGRDAEAQRFSAMFEKIRAAFQQEWLRPDGQLAVETQTAYLLALAFHLLPEEVRARAAARLVENIRALDWHLSTGFIGISHLNPILTLTGHADVAYRLLLRDDYPSWLYPVKHGATTIWERWNGWTKEDGFFNPQMNSFNHYSLGSVGEWLFRHVAGIELDPDVGGFQRFVLQPFPGAGLSWANATYQTMHGEIASAWKHRGNKFTWKIRVPPNTTARVCLPSEPGTPVATAGLAIIDRAGNFAICEAPAGCYELQSTLRVSSAKRVKPPVAKTRAGTQKPRSKA
jgi:alpha-L-rhamnosidase